MGEGSRASTHGNGLAAGAKVWIKATGDTGEAFAAATVKSIDGKEGKCVVTMDENSLERTVRVDECSPANPPDMVTPDNTFLIHISEATILSNMRARFAQDKIYTMTGSILLAVNPFQRLPIYGEEAMPRYKGKRLGAAGTEPHAYAMAEVAYAMLRRTGASQSLAVSGESGAGKTETNKALMNYLAWRSRQPEDERASAAVSSSSEGQGSLAEVILQADPILEAFGNAKTSRNNNSSRFGKFLLVGLSPQGEVLGATTRHYLLEKSRVPWQAKGERNYHSFYQLVAGHADKSALGLKGPESFYYLNQSGVTAIPGQSDADLYAEMRASMTAIKMATGEQDAVFTLLAGLLHLGNVSFVGDESSEIAPASQEALAFVQKLLGLPDIVKCLLKRTMTTPSGTTVLDNSPDKAVLARDALAKALYSRVFDHLLVRINESIKGSMKDDSLFIGLLDVFGFEFFEVNSYEQLCINFANEKLQQFFLKFIFKAELDLYTEEELTFSKIEYNDNQGGIDIIEKSPSGILRLLDETCKKPGSTDKNFCDAVASTHKKSNFYLEPRAAGFRQYREDQAFVVRHFAGDVCYLVDTFLEKNNDTLHPDFTSQLVASSHSIIAQLYAEQGGQAKGGKKKGGFNSVSRKYISQLSSLMASLESTQSHFVRCLKPNTQKEKQLFTPSLVLQQLRCSGTVDAVRLMSAGFPTRMPYASIHGRFASLMPDFVQALPPPLFCESLALGLAIPSDSFQLGKSMIFFRAGQGGALEELGQRDTKEVVEMLTGNEEFMEKVKDYQRRRVALLKVQAGFKAYRQKQWYRKIVVINQIVANQKHVSEARMKGMKAAQASMLSAGGWKSKGMLRLKRRKEEERLAAEAAAQAEREKRASYIAEKARQEAEDAAREQEAAKAAAEAAAAPVRGERIETVQGQPIVEVEANEAPTADGVGAGHEGAQGPSSPGKLGKAALRGKWQGARLAAVWKARKGSVVDRINGPKAKVDPVVKPTPKTKIPHLSMPNASKVVHKLTRTDHGDFGINVELAVGSEAVVVSFVAPGSEPDAKGLVVEGDVLHALAYTQSDSGSSTNIELPTLEQATEAFAGAGDTIEVTLMRLPPVLLLKSEMKMQVGAETQWDKFLFQLYSNRTMSFEKTEPPFYNGAFSLRKCVGLALHQRPAGDGAEIVIEMMGGHQLHLRSEKADVPRAWQRELCFLLPEVLGAQELKAGWLRVQTPADAHPRRVRVVLASSGRLSCFADASANSRRLGTMDVRHAELYITDGKACAFELQLQNDYWIMAAASQDEQSDWLAALRSVVTKEATHSRQQLSAAVHAVNGSPPDHAGHDPHPRKRGLIAPMSAADIFARHEFEEELRSGYAELRVAVEGHVSWEKHWFVLSSGHLAVYSVLAKGRADAAHSKSKKSGAYSANVSDISPDISVQLQDVETVHRSHGEDDFAHFGLEVGRGDKEADTIIRFRPPTQEDMQAWLGSLHTAIAAVKAKQRAQHETVCTMRAGSMKTKALGKKMSFLKSWDWHYFVLQSWQTQRADEDIDVRFELLRFSSAKAANEFGAPSAGSGRLSLSGLEKVRKAANNELQLVFHDTTVALRTASPEEHAQWFQLFDGIRGGQDPEHHPAPTAQLKENITTIDAATFQLQMPKSDTWEGTAFTLRSDGIFASAQRSVDVKQSIGVWVIGPPEWRRLQIVNPDGMVTLASKDNALLDRWALELQNLAPGKHVTEMRHGWMEKRGERSGNWKMRFFVLLSTHELLMYTNDVSRMAKNSFDLKKVSKCHSVSDYTDEGYDSVFVLEGQDIKLTLCVDNKQEMRAWMALFDLDLKSSAVTSQAEAVPKGRGRRKSIGAADAAPRESVSGRSSSSYLSSTRTAEGRYYVIDESGRLSSTLWANEGGKSLDQQHQYQDRRRRVAGLGKDVVKVGWLSKCSQFDAADWKRRYFVLRPEPSDDGPVLLLHYYDTPEDAQRYWYGGGSICLGDATKVVGRPDVKAQGHDYQTAADGVQRTDLTYHMHCFELITPERSFLLSAPNATELSAWMAALDTKEKPGRRTVSRRAGRGSAPPSGKPKG